MPLSSTIKQTKQLLEEVLRAIEKDYEDPYPVLCEVDRIRFVEEEQSLQKQLEVVRESESNCSTWMRLLLLHPSPQSAAKCLSDAQELRQRVEEDMNAKRRSRLTGRGNLSLPSTHGHGPAGTPGIDAGILPTEGNPGPPSVIVTSPLNMSCSLRESEVNVDPAVRHDYAPDINEAINSPLAAGNESHDGTGNPSGPPKRSPPPPPPPRQTALSSLSLFSSDASDDDSPRRSSTFRRPAPSPPQSPRQSRSPRPPTNLFFPSPGPFPDPAMVSSMSSIAQEMNSLASSIVAGASRQAPHGRRSQRSGSYACKTNCVDVTGSTVEGMTINVGGTKNSGGVIHKTTTQPLRVS